MPQQPCSKCHKQLNCEINSGQCWCMQLPALLPLNENSHCLCKSCLIEQINHFLQTKYDALALTELITFAHTYAKPATMTEDIDYYKENELFVFTKWFHLKRGKCCNSNCRHCPYKKE